MVRVRLLWKYRNLSSKTQNEIIMQKNKIRTVVAGVGFIGPIHIESLKRINTVDVVAIFHPDEESAKEKAMELGVPSYYTDYTTMLEEEDFSCIHICSPNHMHYEMAKAAILRGKHVVCEKPLAISIKEAEELLLLAEQEKCVHAVNFNVRYYPLIREMKKQRENGQLGDLHSVIGSYLQDWLFLATDYNWRLEKSQSGDSRAIADIGSHLMDLIEYVTGLKIVKVMADFSTVHPIRKRPTKPIETYSGKILKAEDYEDVPINTEDYASVLLRFEDGTRGVITVSQVAAGRKNRISLEISGSQQTMAWCSESPNELWIGKRDTANHLLMRDPALVDAEVRSIISYPGGHNEGFGDTTKQLFKEFYSDIEKGTKDIVPYPSFKDGLRELVLCEAILESQKHEKWISV